MRFLDKAAQSESAMKHYVIATHAWRSSEGPILDLGCGAGHDLALLTASGLRAVGIDPSMILLRAAAGREPAASCLVRCTGEALPFRDGSFAGCRIERVLLHVIDPFVVLAEAVRCLKERGLITVFEPDWTHIRVRSESGDDVVEWVPAARNPGVGKALWRLVEDAGCQVLHRVEELSVWRSMEMLDRVFDLSASLDRAVSAGRLDSHQAARWLTDQRARDANGTFRATIPKVLIVATKQS